MNHGGGYHQQRVQHQRENVARQSTRQAFHRPHTFMGSTAYKSAGGHWLTMAGIVLPMVVGEFIPDPTKKWRAVRLVTVGVILLKELFWSKKIGREREESHENAVRCAEEIAGACGGGMGPGL
jgi:hypothetical protein